MIFVAIKFVNNLPQLVRFDSIGLDKLFDHFPVPFHNFFVCTFLLVAWPGRIPLSLTLL